MQVHMAGIPVIGIKGNVIKVKVIPNARKTEIRSVGADTIKIAVAASPEKDKANKELLAFLKKEFKVNAKIKSGAASREKIVEIFY